MAMNNISEKYKLYFLILMACIAGIIGYVRFLRPPSADGKQLSMDASFSAMDASLPVSLDPDKFQSIGTPSHRMPRRGISRNIFEPMGQLPVAPMPKSTSSHHAAQADLTLSGTIVGPHSSIAIINNKFMRQGQQIGKFRITRITADKVYLTSGEAQLCLNVISVNEAITP